MSPQESYRIAIQTEGMIKDLVINLSSDNDELQMHCASAIFKVPLLPFLYAVLGMFWKAYIWNLRGEVLKM